MASLPLGALQNQAITLLMHYLSKLVLNMHNVMLYEDVSCFVIHCIQVYSVALLVQGKQTVALITQKNGNKYFIFNTLENKE